MEVVLITAGVIVIVIFLIIAMSGPRSEAKLIDQFCRLDDQSLINEFNRVHQWLNRYNSLDPNWKAKAATPDVYEKYEQYYKDLCQERNRRYFFQNLKEGVPELKILTKISYDDALNDSMTNIAWQMKCNGYTMDDIFAWYRKELGKYDAQSGAAVAATSTLQKPSSEADSHTKKIPIIDLEIVDDPLSSHLSSEEKENIRRAALQSIDQPEYAYVSSESANIVSAITKHINYQAIFREDPSDMAHGIQDMGVPKDAYVRETFVGNLAFAFYRITERSIFSGSHEEKKAFFDALLENIKESQPYNMNEIFSKFSELSSSIRGRNEDSAEKIVIDYVKKALSITGPGNEELFERLYGRLQVQLLKWNMIENAFLRAGYWELYRKS
jgi:hypothetical protein